MLLLLTLLTAGYLAAVGRVWRARRRARGAAAGAAASPGGLPADDQPPPSAIGWPPDGPAFAAYVDEGFAALDAYLSEGYAT